MRKMQKRKIAKTMVKVLLCISILTPVLSGCTKKEETANLDNVVISIGSWPADNKIEELKSYDNMVSIMAETYPNIKIVPDKWVYDVKTFLPKASSNQLPTMYKTYFTEINKIIDSNYAADVTEYMKKYGYTEAMNADLLDMVTKDGKIYGIPLDGYAQGLAANKTLFKQAGLVNADGTVQFPDTYEELAETAKIIKEKTGKAGFGIATMKNQGGWHFMNIAWSYGTQFMAEENGKWNAKFDSPECIAALQYVKDLKWKYDVLPDNAFVDKNELNKLFATDQLAMCFAVPPVNELIRDYEMEREVLSVGRMLSGPKGRFSQMGGNVIMLAPNATAEQIDAVFKWLEISGITPKVNDVTMAKWENDNKKFNAEGIIVLDQTPFKIWTNGERMDAETEIKRKYVNINPADFKDYYEFKDVTIKSEEPMCCQELYNTFDACIQAVITDKDADVAAIVKKAASDFQTNYLDKINEE